MSSTIRSTLKRSRTLQNRRLSHLPAQTRVVQQSDDRGGHRLRIPRRNEQTREAVFDDFRNSTRRGRHDGLAARHGIEQRRAETFGHRAHDENVEDLVQRQHVRPEAKKDDVLLEMPIANLALERMPQLALAGNHEPGIRDLTDDDGGGVDQVPLSLVRDERGHVPDDRRVPRQPELLVQVARRRGVDALEIDPFVDHDGPGRRHAIGDQHRADGLGDADEAVHLPVLPA